MRGKGERKCTEKIKIRITPAYAGKSNISSNKSTASWDHPRVCGEKQTCSTQNGLLQGSPPRMRGKEVEKINISSVKRITPAYAGKRIPKVEVV